MKGESKVREKDQERGGKSRGGERGRKKEGRKGGKEEESKLTGKRHYNMRFQIYINEESD